MKLLGIFAVFSILTWVHFTHCQDRTDVLLTKVDLLMVDTLEGMADFKKKQNEILEVLKGFEDLQQKQNDIIAKLSGYEDLQQKQNDILAKLSGYEELLQEIPGLHRDLELVKGIHQDTKGCLGREDLEHFKNILSAGIKELESSLHQEISGVISLLETGGIDECSEGSHNCTDYEACTDKFVHCTCTCLSGFARDGLHCEDIDECAQGKDECSPLATCRNSVGSYSCSCNPPSEGDGRTCDIDECSQGKDECSPLATCRNSVGSYSCSCNPPFEGDGRTCSCPSGFAQKGSNCEDIDECAEGKAQCSPQATCRNSVGSYSCSCNPPFEGDGRTCEFPCRSPAKVFEGLGCVKHVKELKTFEEMNATCHQAGGRLLQNFSIERLQEVGRTFPYGREWTWIGVQERKWLESGLPLQEELWEEGSRGSDPSRMRGLCGAIMWDHSSSSYKVDQLDCSSETWGYCQFINPQK